MNFLISKLLLGFLVCCGLWTLWGFPYNNGLLQILDGMTKSGAVIPGPKLAPMKQSYTGVARIDKQLTILVSFFYTAIDGNRLDVSIQFLDLGGQVLAAWVLITIEGMRQGNKNKLLINLTTVFGILVAVVGFACIAPLWFVAHLITSPTANDPNESQLILKQPSQLAVAPLSILMGFGVPSLIMTLPAPSILSFETKQLWTGIQQGWPIWIAVSQFVLTRVASVVKNQSAVMTLDETKAQSIKYLRRAYLFAMMSAVGVHLLSWGASLSAYAAPYLFGKSHAAQLHPANAFMPVNPFGDRKANTLADGALWFLQWDLIIGTAATLIWGLTLRTAAKQELATPTQVVVGAIKIILLTLLLGPAATGVVAVWGRDELVFRRSARKEKSKEI